MVSSRSWGIVSLIASWQCSFLSLWESICTRNFFVKVNPEKCWRQVQARMRTKGLYTSAFSIGILSRSFTSQNLWDQLLCSDARLDKFSWLLFSLNHNTLTRCKKLTDHCDISTYISRKTVLSGRKRAPRSPKRGKIPPQSATIPNERKEMKITNIRRAPRLRLAAWKVSYVKTRQDIHAHFKLF